MNNLSIKTKTLISGLVPVFITAFLLSGVYLWQRLKDIDSDLLASINNSASLIAAAGEFDIISRNRQGLHQLVSAYVNDEAILNIQVLDDKNSLITEYSKEHFDASHLVTDDAIIIKKPVTPVTINISEYDNKNLQDIKNNTATPVGYIRLTATRQHATARKQLLVSQGLVITLFSLLIALFFSFYLSNSLSKPLQQISEIVAKITQGRMDLRAPEESGGEIGMLQKNINSMANSIAQSRILEREQAENILYIEKSKAMTTLESLGEGVITTDTHGIITYINPAASKLTGFSSPEAIGNSLHKVFRTINTNSMKSLEYPIQSCIEFGTTIRHDALLRLVRQDGNEIVIRDTATTIRDYNHEIIGAVLIFDDFTSLHAMAERLVYQATHDDLTGLFNRREFENQLDLALHQTHTTDTQNVLCYIDLDQFKIINDTCGHIAGDELLRQMSQIIKGKIREGDILARLGGDEFGILLKNCQKERADIVAQSILDEFSHYFFIWGESRYQLGASIGMVVLNKSHLSLTDVLIAADSACYIAKDQGRNRIHVYTPTDTELFRRRGDMKWFQRIKESLQEDRFELLAQPIVLLSKNQETESHYEILLRLRDGDALFSPEAFLSTAERYNLMPQIDRWVIKNTLAIIRKLSIKNPQADVLPRFNINLSGQSLSNHDFQSYVMDQMVNSGVNPTLVTFEITETAAITNLSSALVFMKTFRELGCQFALDDFGSGLSSFGYLTTLPIDFIKIDGKLITGINSSPINLSIVDAVNRIAHQMGLITIAEYVEDKLLLERVRSLGIDYAQGYAVAKPHPLQSFIES